jgi:hypothetical protein
VRNAGPAGCRCGFGPSYFGAGTSQSRTVLSSLPEATVLPSGLYARARMNLAGMVIWARALRIATPQSMMTPSIRRSPQSPPGPPKGYDVPPLSDQLSSGAGWKDIVHQKTIVPTSSFQRTSPVSRLIAPLPTGSG